MDTTISPFTKKRNLTKKAKAEMTEYQANNVPAGHFIRPAPAGHRLWHNHIITSPYNGMRGFRAFPQEGCLRAGETGSV